MKSVAENIEMKNGMKLVSEKKQKCDAMRKYPTKKPRPHLEHTIGFAYNQASPVLREL